MWLCQVDSLHFMTCYVAWVPLGLDSDSTCLSNPFKKLWNSHWIHRPLALALDTLKTFGCLSPARPGPRARDHVDKVPWSSSSFTHYSQAVVEKYRKYKHLTSFDNLELNLKYWNYSKLCRCT